MTEASRVNSGGGGGVVLLRRLLFHAMMLLLVILVPRSARAQSSRDIKVEVSVPKEAEVGKSVSLDCTWRLNGSLYTVKWTKDEYEIFSYNPENEPRDRVKSFPRDGFKVEYPRTEVYVDRQARTDNKITIRLAHMTFNSSGQYKCEVSTGAPYFHTNFRAGNITVISLPSQGPEIYGLAKHYALGDNVTANCTSWPSIPKATLIWVINNKTVSSRYVVDMPPLKSIDPKSGFPNSLGLRMNLDGNYGNNGKLRVRCIAYVGTRKFETEKYASLAHANNQRFSAFDMRSSATYSAIYSVTLMLIATLVTT